MSVPNRMERQYHAILSLLWCIYKKTPGRQETMPGVEIRFFPSHLIFDGQASPLPCCDPLIHMIGFFKAQILHDLGHGAAAVAGGAVV